jgi:hypothetical protein
MDRAAYDALDAINWSRLRLMGKSAAHFKAGTADTDSMRKGRVKHLAVLEPQKLETEVAVFPGRRAGKKWEEFELANAHREIVTETEWNEVQAVASAVRAHPLARQLLSVGQPEVSIEWEADGLKAKSRLDWLAPTHAADLKFTKDSSPTGFPREFVRYDMAGQSGFYSDAVKFKTGQDLPYFIIAAESVAPFAVTVFRVPPDVVDLGRATYRRYLRQLEWCREKNEWAPYSESEVLLQLPSYAFSQEEE